MARYGGLRVTKVVENPAPVRCFIGRRRMYQDTRVYGVGWGPRLIVVFFGTAGAVSQKWLIEGGREGGGAPKPSGGSQARLASQTDNCA